MDDDDDYDTNSESLADEMIVNTNISVLENFEFMRSYDVAQPSDNAIDNSSERQTSTEQTESIESTNKIPIKRQEVRKAQSYKLFETAAIRTTRNF